MLARFHSMGVVGIDAFPVEVEVYVTRSELPSATLVGLPDASVKESIDRVRAREEQMDGMVVPLDNAREAAVVEGLDVVPVNHLSKAIAFLSGSHIPDE